MNVKELLDYALSIMSDHGLKYGDARWRKSRYETIETRNEVLRNFNDDEEEGIAIRVLNHGRWGFASTSLTTKEGVAKATLKAIEITEKINALSKQTKLNIPPITLSNDIIPKKSSFKTKVEIDPFLLHPKEKIGMLENIYNEVRGSRGFKKVDCNLHHRKFHQHLHLLSGAQLENEIYLNELTYSVMATNNGDFQSRTFFGIPRSAGHESILEQNPIGHAKRVAEEAYKKLMAPKGPYGEKDLILLPSHLFLTIHESVGHPTELDRVLGWEANYAGTSFATPEKLNHFQYGSSIVNFEVDNQMGRGLATLGHDDDGIPSKKFDLIRDGILVSYSTTRETAPLLGESQSLGCNRADSYKHMPINRIPNLSLKPGKTPLSLEELIEDTEDGILIDGRGSFSIDQKRLNFQFGGDYFLEIKKGKVVGPLRDVTYQSMTPTFWQSCDAICDERFWLPYGTLNCGKGEPTQIEHMTHGCAPARFRNILVGGALR